MEGIEVDTKQTKGFIEYLLKSIDAREAITARGLGNMIHNGTTAR